MKSDLDSLQEISFAAMLKAFLRENFILKVQLGLLHDTLIDRGIIDEDELQPKFKQYMSDLDEKEFKAYLIETAKIFESFENENIYN